MKKYLLVLVSLCCVLSAAFAENPDYPELKKSDANIIVQINKKTFVFHHPTSITKYLPRLQNAFSSVIFNVILPSSSFTNS